MGPELFSQLIAFTIPLALNAPQPETIAWEDLVAVPDAQLGELVQMHVQAHSQPQTWEPFLTRFSPEEYVCLRAWSDQQMPWVEEHFDEPQVVVFARRGSRQAERLLAADPHERLALGCTVRAHQAGMVWIEVLGACTTREQITEGAVLHVEKAIELLERDAPQMAREQLARALTAPLPQHARKDIEVILEQCDARIRGIETRNAAFRRRYKR